VNLVDPSGCAPCWKTFFKRGLAFFTEVIKRIVQSTLAKDLKTNKYEEMVEKVKNHSTTMTIEEYNSHKSPYLGTNRTTTHSEYNCSFYAALRYEQVWGRDFSGDWHPSGEISQTPKAGSIAYFEDSRHYVFIEYVYDDIIFFSDANWSDKTDFQYQMLTFDEFKKRGNKQFKGFLD